jgi:hypothetical protein
VKLAVSVVFLNHLTDERCCARGVRTPKRDRLITVGLLTKRQWAKGVVRLAEHLYNRAPMDWKQLLDHPKELPSISKYICVDEDAIARREARLTKADFELLLANTFVPAIEEFLAEVNKKGRDCAMLKAPSSASITVRYDPKQEIKVRFTAGSKGISYDVMSPILSGTFRADTNAGKITREEVLNLLAVLNLSRVRK